MLPDGRILSWPHPRRAASTGFVSPADSEPSSSNIFRGQIEERVSDAPPRRVVRHERDMAFEESFSGTFELLTAALEAVEARSQEVCGRLTASEAACTGYAGRLVRAEDAATRLRNDHTTSRERECKLRAEVGRLAAMLERLQARSARDSEELRRLLAEERLRTALAEERLRAAAALNEERLRAMRDEALLQRNDALTELAMALEEVGTAQVALAGAELELRELRQRLRWLETRQQSGRAARSSEGAGAGGGGESVGALSATAVQREVEGAVMEAAACEEAERRQRIRALQLRWHPDKNPVLRELATEVTKMINEAVERIGASQ